MKSFKKLREQNVAKPYSLTLDYGKLQLPGETMTVGGSTRADVIRRNVPKTDPADFNLKDFTLGRRAETERKDISASNYIAFDQKVKEREAELQSQAAALPEVRPYSSLYNDFLKSIATRHGMVQTTFTNPMTGQRERIRPPQASAVFSGEELDNFVEPTVQQRRKAIEDFVITTRSGIESGKVVPDEVYAQMQAQRPDPEGDETLGILRATRDAFANQLGEEVSMKTFKELRSRLNEDNEDFIQRAMTRLGVETKPYAVDTMPRVTATPENIAAYERKKRDAQDYVNRFGGIKVVQDPRNLEAFLKDPSEFDNQVPMQFIVDPGEGGVGEIERKGRAELAAQEAEQRQGAIDMARHTRQMSTQNRRLERQASAAQSRFAQMSADAGRRAAEKRTADAEKKFKMSEIERKGRAELAAQEAEQRQGARDAAREAERIQAQRSQSALTQTQAERDKAQSELDAARARISSQADELLSRASELQDTQSQVAATADALKDVTAQNQKLNALLSQLTRSNN